MGKSTWAALVRGNCGCQHFESVCEKTLPIWHFGHRPAIGDLSGFFNRLELPYEFSPVFNSDGVLR